MTRVSVSSDVRAFARFATVGIVSNLLLYLLYLALTVGAGMEPVIAATIGWIVGVSATFLANRSWTWADRGARAPAFARYGILYASAYALNIVLLVLLVDRAGLPHELVQGVLILLFGLGLFLAQRFWVFRERATG